MSGTVKDVVVPPISSEISFRPSLELDNRGTRQRSAFSGNAGLPRLDLQQQRIRSALRFLLIAMIPAGFTGLLIFKYWVNTPIGDEWHVVSLLEKFALGTLSFQDLFAQQNEYRQFFPNLIFVALGWLTKWYRLARRQVLAEALDIPHREPAYLFPGPI